MRRLQRADLALIAAVVMLAAALFSAGIVLRGSSGGAAKTVTVRCEGEEIARFSLAEDGVYPISSAYGYNELTVSDGAAWMSAADCTGGDCLRMPALPEAGGMIVCLPHRLIVRVEGGEPELDAVVR